MSTPEQRTPGISLRPGFVWLDNATMAAGGESVVAMQPVAWLRGNLWKCADYLALAEALAGYETGRAMGVIGYDGHFAIGIYPDLLTCGQQWREEGDPFERWDNCNEALREIVEADGRPAELVDRLLRMDQTEGPRMELDFRALMPPERFLEMVRRAKEYIAAGDIYQVNLSHRLLAWTRSDNVSGIGLYRRLREVSPAPMAAYLHLPGGREVLSASMETFLKMEGRAVSTCPIKGTRPRTGDPARDAVARRELAGSPKERAELVMITDLERNDLGQVCEFGSVHVPRFLEIEEYAQVFHQVSEVRGTLREGVTHLEALRACFPGGSITGAPKKRAREIIAELEPGPRGLYTGAMGYFGLGKNAVSQWNIAIRTVVIEAPDPVTQLREAHFHVGAGIVADSDPAGEYQETLDKAAGILLAAGAVRE